MDLDGELFLELQTRLAKPKVAPPKKKEDALLRKRIEKDKAKAKDQQSKVGQCLFFRVSGKLCMFRLGRKRMKRLNRSFPRVILSQMVWRPWLFDGVVSE